MYLFYVDESGDRGVRLPADRKLYADANRFYVLLACGILDHYWFKFEQHINTIRRRILDRINLSLNLVPQNSLGLHDAEIKSQYIRNVLSRRRSAFWPHVWNDEIEEIVSAAYRALEYFHLDLCAVVIDKEHLPPHYNSNELHRKSYELLLERIQNLMRERYYKHKALLIVDGSNNTENMSLIQRHDFFLNEGRTSSGCRLDKIAQSPLFIKSELAVGIQMSDLCAYSIHRAFKSNDLQYDYFTKLVPYFYNSLNTQPNKIDGLKVFPASSPFAQ